MKNLPYSAKTKECARNLRKNMTAEERHLWYDFLCTYPVSFRRQRRILEYIVDFYCKEAALVIEIDGSQHYDPDHIEEDLQRTKKLEKLGITVMRFTNREIKYSFQEVCQAIHQEVCNLANEK